MDDSWVTLQLHYSEEKATSDEVEKSIKSTLPGCEIFTPSLHFKDKRGEYSYSLFDGYLFVRGDFSDFEYLKLNSNTYVYKVLTSTPTSGCVGFTPNGKIEVMRAQLQALIPTDFEEDSTVFIHRGLFSGLKGKVIGVEGEKVIVEVYMPLGSLTKLTRVPKMFIRPVTPEDD